MQRLINAEINKTLFSITHTYVCEYVNIFRKHCDIRHSNNLCYISIENFFQEKLHVYLKNVSHI